MVSVVATGLLSTEDYLLYVFNHAKKSGYKKKLYFY